MRNKYILLFFSFLLLFIQINSDCINSKNDKIYSIYDICPEGCYGENCHLNCSCDMWSSSKNCSRFDGRCLDCKFGHFDTNCENICNPKCKTNLCCEVKHKDFEKTNIKISSKVSLLKIKIGNKTLSIYPDYNVGYPLTIFKNVEENIDIFNCFKSDDIYEYTDFYVNNTKKCDNAKISIENNDKSHLDLNISIFYDSSHENNTLNVDGVIGLGFSNPINVYLLNNKKISLNIASFEIKDDQISILFGNLFDDEKKFVHKLSFCNAKSNELTGHTAMKCQIEGMRSQKYSEALKLDDIEINFSLNQPTSFVLPNEERYVEYIKKYYFNEKNKDYKMNKTTDKTYLCYKHKKINKLNDFGFVINKYYYSYKADQLFYRDDDTCGSDYYKFVIEFNNNAGETKIIFGKTLFKEAQFTIDNEERKIYFYTKHVEYFSGKLVEESNMKKRLSSNPLRSSLITVGIVLLMNVVSFLVYFYFKRKKSK